MLRTSSDSTEDGAMGIHLYGYLLFSVWSSVLLPSPGAYYSLVICCAYSVYQLKAELVMGRNNVHFSTSVLCVHLRQTFRNVRKGRPNSSRDGGGEAVGVALGSKLVLPVEVSAHPVLHDSDVGLARVLDTVVVLEARLGGELVADDAIDGPHRRVHRRTQGHAVGRLVDGDEFAGLTRTRLLGVGEDDVGVWHAQVGGHAHGQEAVLVARLVR